MGANIAELFQQMTIMSDEEISAIHPQHNKDSIKSLLPRLRYFQVRAICFEGFFYMFKNIFFLKRLADDFSFTY